MINLNYLRQTITIQFEEIFSKCAENITFIMHEALSLLKVLETKRQIKSKFSNNSDLYYTIIRSFSDGGEK